jgi:hypothetical protein
MTRLALQLSALLFVRPERHDQRRSAQAGVHKRGDDRARLPFGASSMLNECGLWNANLIERQLAHVDNDSVRRAYARAVFWEERVRIMDWWAERC